MISFDLCCANEHVFEAWFANSAAYDRQADAGEITCPICGDRHLSKALMAPNVALTRQSAEQPKGEQTVAAADGAVDRVEAVLQFARALSDEIEKNFDNVGDGFAEEARKIHYQEIEHRNIYGEMTRDDAQDLREEGVEFGVLPWPTKEDA